MNARGEYRRQAIPCGTPAGSSIAVGVAAPETRRVLTNVALIAVGSLIGFVGWREYKQDKPLGVIALGSSGSLISSGIAGLLLDREGA